LELEGKKVHFMFWLDDLEELFMFLVVEGMDSSKSMVLPPFSAAPNAHAGPPTNSAVGDVLHPEYNFLFVLLKTLCSKQVNHLQIIIRPIRRGQSAVLAQNLIIIT
jgi:hypothetical protein